MATLLWEWKPRFAVALVVRDLLIVTSHANCDVTSGPVVMRRYANADGDEQRYKTPKTQVSLTFCEARRASHCHSPQTTFSSNSTCCVLSTQKSAMYVVVYADRLTTQHSIVDIVHWSWSYWQFWYPRWHVECFWPALAAHWISSASHTSVLPQHPRRKIVPYRVGWNHHTSDYHG